jgi:hypothetical protein
VIVGKAGKQPGLKDFDRDGGLPRRAVICLRRAQRDQKQYPAKPEFTHSHLEPGDLIVKSEMPACHDPLHFAFAAKSSLLTFGTQSYSLTAIPRVFILR